jgi:hypothetical protein
MARPRKNPRWEELPQTTGEVIAGIAERLRFKHERIKFLNDPAEYLFQFVDYHPWSKQKDIIRSVFKNKITLVRSCNDVGKTHVVGQIHWAWLDIYRPFGKESQTKVISTSKTFDSLKFMLWTRIRQMYKFVASRFQFAPVNLTDFTPDPDTYPEWFSVGYNPKIEGDEATAFQGHHGDHVLFILEECISIATAVFRAVEGSLLDEGSRELAIYNPTTTIGSEVYQMEQESIPYKDGMEPEMYRPVLITISAQDLWDSPEYKEDPSRYKQLVSPEGASALEKKYGREHPVTKARIYGEWPEESEDQALSTEAVRYSMNRWQERGDELRPGIITDIYYGWDVAGEGSDSNVLYRGEAYQLASNFDQDGEEEIDARTYIAWEKIKQWNGDHAKSLKMVYIQIMDDWQTTKDRNEAFAEEHNQPHLDCEPDLILTVDAIGEGSHVASLIEEMDTNNLITVIPFKAGMKSDGIEERKEIPILNLISEAWFRMGLVLNETVPDFPILIIQENKDLFFEMVGRKRDFAMKLKEPIVYFIEPKDEFKKRNRGKSPDHADALLMGQFGYFVNLGSRPRFEVVG